MAAIYDNIFGITDQRVKSITQTYIPTTEYGFGDFNQFYSPRPYAVELELNAFELFHLEDALKMLDVNPTRYEAFMDLGKEIDDEAPNVKYKIKHR